MSWRIAATLCVLPMMLGGCPKPEVKSGGDSGGTKTPLPPAVPATIETVKVPPQVGHDPAAKSPIIDLMSKENQRWFEALSSATPAPAHFIGYTIHERQSVSIEAEDGVLLADDDGAQRVLDVEVRVGSQQLDSRHPLKDPRLAAFTSLPRLSTMPF